MAKVRKGVGLELEAAIMGMRLMASLGMVTQGVSKGGQRARDFALPTSPSNSILEGNSIISQNHLIVSQTKQMEGPH